MSRLGVFTLLAFTALLLSAARAEMVAAFRSLQLEEGEILCNCSLRAGLCGLAHQGPLAHVCKTKGGCLKEMSRPSPKEDPDRVQVEYRCVPLYHWTPPERPLMCETHSGLVHQLRIRCCRHENFCAQHLNLTLAEAPPDPAIAQRRSDLLVGAAIGVPLTLAMLLGLAYLVFHYQRHRCKRLIAKESFPASRVPLIQASSEMATLNKLLLDMDDASSGSGSGLPLLVQRTIARQIDLERKIGEGRFGMVYKGSWRCSDCAVKIFQSRDEASWFREVQIYQTNMLRHPNVLGFFASDNKDTGTNTQLWLVTEYHPEGSLCDFLIARSVTLKESIVLARSLANGLAFLHAETVGTHSKPGIAHRDIKSKNVLVKRNGECCIGDLGMAVRYLQGTLDLPENAKAGTRRYCAPEVLSESLAEREFEAHRRADVYSLGLTLWEIAWRTELEGRAEEAELPYYEWVESDPSIEQMRIVVCEQRRRPIIPNRWSSNSIMLGLSKLLRECWTENPSARLPALRVKKSLDALAIEHALPSSAQAQSKALAL